MRHLLLILVPMIGCAGTPQPVEVSGKSETGTIVRTFTGLDGKEVKGVDFDFEVANAESSVTCSD